MRVRALTRLPPPSPTLCRSYHRDLYPADKSGKMQAPRRGDGQDFDPAAAYRMYHGERVPGFPQHPHRGFETLTAVLEGNCDHTDSLGNGGRFSSDDLQWMTAGRGCVHGENFPLIHEDKLNTLRLFQIWLNLPKVNKMADPGYVMHWAEKLTRLGGEGGAVARVFAGKLGEEGQGQTPPPSSWAADPRNDVAVFHVTLPKGGAAKFTLPPAAYGREINRALYVVEGRNVCVGGRSFKGQASVDVHADQPVELHNDDGELDAEVLVLQGRPIGEPVAQRGPFVMNTNEELAQSFGEYRATQFGGWPWPQDAVIFPRDAGRFSSKKGADGTTTTEKPGVA